MRVYRTQFRFSQVTESKRKVSALLVGVLISGMMGVAGCERNPSGSQSNFELQQFDSLADAYRSDKWIVRSEVKIQKSPTGLHCVVQGEAGEGEGPYGGIMLRAPGATGCRFELGFPDPDSILAVYVDGYDAQKKRVFRWQTAKGAKIRRERVTYVFRPGESLEGFEPVASDVVGPVEKIYLFVRVKPGTSASFDLYSVEMLK